MFGPRIAPDFGIVITPLEAAGPRLDPDFAPEFVYDRTAPEWPDLGLSGEGEVE